MPGSEMHSYFAAPLPDASNEVDRLTDWVLQNQGRRFPTNALARFERSEEFNGLQWKGLPYMWPFLRSITDDHQNFVYAGGFPNPKRLSDFRANGWRNLWLAPIWFITTPKRPARGSDNGFTWANLPVLCRTMPSCPPNRQPCSGSRPFPQSSVTQCTHVTETAPDQLSFTRRSSIGFTAVELNLLADWLESPQFPVGLHTLLAPPDGVQ